MRPARHHSPICASLVTLLLALLPAHAEVRTFSNAEGKTIKAELLALQDDVAVLKLPSGKRSKVALKNLSEADQAYVRAWHEKNKFKGADLRLDVFRDNQMSRSTNKKVKTKTFRSTYICTLDNFSPREYPGLTLNYTIYERVTDRGASGTSTTIEETTETMNLGTLKGNGKIDFKSKTIVSTHVDPIGRNEGTRRETVVAVVFDFMVGDQLIFRQSHPENYLDHLEEEAKREKAREKAEDKRDQSRDR